MTKTLLAGLLAGFALIGTANAAPQTYTLDPGHTTIIWNAEHMGFSHPHGLFSMAEGTLTLDEAAPENSKVEATVKLDNLFTGQEKFDDHLKSKDFFNVKEFPVATFKSTKVEKTGDKTAKVTGDLTMLGVTKPLTLDVTYNKSAPNPMSQKPTVGFSAKGVIKRSDWGMKYGLPNISDDVPIVIEAEANQDKK